VVAFPSDARPGRLRVLVEFRPSITGEFVGPRLYRRNAPAGVGESLGRQGPSSSEIDECALLQVHQPECETSLNVMFIFECDPTHIMDEIKTNETWHR
jgi:hypothetical protein